MTDYAFHPIAERFELMTGKQFERFTQRMKENGYDTKKPIVLFEGMILDGRNRYRAAKSLGIAPSVVEYAGEWGDPWNFVLVQNADRCHYSFEGLALLAAAEHKYGGYAHGGERGQVSNRTLAQVGEDHGISPQTVRRAKKVLDADPDVKELVAQGDASITDAAEVASQPKEVQREAAKAVKNGKAKTLSAHVNGKKGKGDAWEGEPDEIATDAERDRRGTPLPSGLKDIFASPIFASCVQHLREARRALDGIAKHSHYQPKPAEFAQSLRHIEEVVSQNVPHAVCPSCHGEECDDCRKMGWVPEWRYDELTMTQGSRAG